MPKNKGKAKGKKDAAAPAQADEGFDDMLAEICAADPIVTTPESISVSSSSGSSVSSRSSSSSSCKSTSSSAGSGRGVPSSAVRSSASRNHAYAPEPLEEMVTEDMLVDACIGGDMALLQRWVRRGIRVSSAEPLCQAALHGKIDVVRYLVSDLSADVNQADDQGFTPLCIAAENGYLAVMRCLVKELGTDVNKASKGGATPLYIAAQEGHLNEVRCLVKEQKMESRRCTLQPRWVTWMWCGALSRSSKLTST
jgi:hypothetical protein